MRNLISYNTSFIWNDKLRDRNICISNFNTFYLEAKEQDNFYIKQDLDTTLNSIIIELIEFKEYNELKLTYPWLSPDSYNLLYTLLNIKRTDTVSDNLIDYNNNHQFNFSSWMGISEQNINEYCFDVTSWKNMHANFVMNYSRHERTQNHEYFKKFCRGKIKTTIPNIKNKIKSGAFKEIDRIDDPPLANGKVLHNQQIHIHFKDGGALNIDGTEKHPLKKNISNKVADYLVEIGFILPENL